MAVLSFIRRHAISLLIFSIPVLFLWGTALFALIAPNLGYGRAHDFVLFHTIGFSRGVLFIYSLALSLIPLGFALVFYWRREIALNVLMIMGSSFVGLMGTFFAIDILVGIRAPQEHDLPGVRRMHPHVVDFQVMDLYPYEGWHMPANHHHVGKLGTEKHDYSDYDIRTGDMGFNTDIDLKNPPEKAVSEIRIIMTGGSGAQGWGGQTNAHMFYSVLQQALNEKFAELGLKVRVINLAMGGSISYQNFISLNRWAHILEPDLILSYAGRNDWRILLQQMNDGHDYFNEISGFSIASRPKEIPPGMGWFAAIFPRLWSGTNFGVAIKMFFFWDYYVNKARRVYLENTGIDATTRMEIINQLATPLYVHSMKSIKRDFQGIPMVVAWQAIHPHYLSPVKERELDAGFYEKMYRIAKRELSGYVNDDWLFIDIHGHFLDKPSRHVNTHLSNTGHRWVGELLAEKVGPWLLSIRARTQ